jgi:hypothetical protein
MGGFSAAALDPADGRLWLLSDTPEPELVPVWGLAALGRLPLRVGRRLPLRGPDGAPFPAPLDGEGLVIDGDDAWIVSEERRSPDRPAQLLRFDRRSGQLRRAQPLPEAWRAAPGRGLGANQGPESLTRLRPLLSPPLRSRLSASPGAAEPALVLAAERPLLLDPPGVIRLLRHGAEGFEPLGAIALALPGPHWGLTELMVLPGGGLLGLVRGFEPPASWWTQLVLLPPLQTQPRSGSSSPLEPLLQPQARWDLRATGLPPDNWEGMAPGAPLPDGRPTLLLVSDDNFSPLQANRLARIAPGRGSGCRPGVSRDSPDSESGPAPPPFPTP